MFVFFIGCLTLLFKWRRLFYVLLSLEFMMMDLFFCFSVVLSGSLFFYFLCFCVIISVLGLLILVSVLKNYGLDCSFYYEFL
uniref:NADH dehydrogenase subunit 4L n=1 Tax=Dracunculus medinensis TaxID=318479 RepID=G3LUG4_DRAME|nr:NADH dehydrogenase subunit 4L [Dracunculus medinensis]AEO27230.1 NADH dehydrogenase subunit 4L [Dracunculus medinensis]BAV81408.1 NADH dehydrogenase subunit 4L [Dracunculus medinensis]